MVFLLEFIFGISDLGYICFDEYIFLNGYFYFFVIFYILVGEMYFLLVKVNLFG